MGKRQVKKGFRRGEKKHYPDRLTARIEREFELHPVTVRKMTKEEMVARARTARDR
jgi:hypothetical protein